MLPWQPAGSSWLRPKKPCLQRLQCWPSTFSLQTHWPVRTSQTPPPREPAGSQSQAETQETAGLKSEHGLDSNPVCFKSKQLSTANKKHTISYSTEPEEKVFFVCVSNRFIWYLNKIQEDKRKKDKGTLFQWHKRATRCLSFDLNWLP